MVDILFSFGLPETLGLSLGAIRPTGFSPIVAGQDAPSPLNPL